MGYANRVITLNFPHLSDDPDNDPIRVVIRNPRLEPPSALMPKDDVEIVNGQVANAEAAMASSAEVIAKLIIGWRVYDPTAPVELDDDLNVVGEQLLLPQVYNSANVQKLPTAILTAINEEVQAAINPQ